MTANDDTTANKMWPLIIALLLGTNPHSAKRISIDDPTAEEVSRAIAIRPPGPWGRRLRHEKCVRLLAIGGSNTYNDWQNQGYVTLLERYLQANVSSDSYIINEGKAGKGPAEFVGKSYKFEKLETSRWPNVVLLEFSVNTNGDDWVGAETLDKLVRTTYCAIISE